MSERKPHVGHVLAARERWQIFNDSYEVTDGGERRRPWSLGVVDGPWAAHHRSMPLNKYFATHREALDFALSEAAK